MSVSDLLTRQFAHTRATATDIIENVAGINAQTARAPVVGLRARNPAIGVTEVGHHLSQYSWVKANLMRGTVHLVTARQYLAWRQALQPALSRTVRQFLPRLRDAVSDHDLLAEAMPVLEAHPCLTRKELGLRLNSRIPHVDPADLGFAARLLCPLVQEAPRSAWSEPSRVRLILASHVLDGELSSAEGGLQDLSRSYARAFGPDATFADFTYWSGLTGVKTSLMRIGFPFSAEPPDATAPLVVITPEYDNIFFCSKTRYPDLTDAKKRLIFSPSAGMYGAVLWANHVVANWRRKPGTEDVAVDFWEPPTDAVRKAVKEFEVWYARQAESPSDQMMREKLSD